MVAKRGRIIQHEERGHLGVLIIGITHGCRFLTVVEVDLCVARAISVVHSRRSDAVDALSLHTDRKVPGIVSEAVVGR